MIDPLASLAIAAGLALLLLLAAWHKTSARVEFGAALRDYRLLPVALLRPAAVLLTAIEFVLAVGWLAASMRLYEVVSVVPGVSLSLRDVLEGDRITVKERSGSRSLGQHEHIAARVVPRGPSGSPEIERGVLHVPRLVKDSVAAQLREHRASFLAAHRGASLDTFYKTMGPFFHEVGWLIGQENFFAWMHTKPDVIHAIIGHMVDYEIEATRRFFAAADGLLDIAYFGNDFGTQRGCFISPELWHEFSRKPLKRRSRPT